MQWSTLNLNGVWLCVKYEIGLSISAGARIDRQHVVGQQAWLGSKIFHLFPTTLLEVFVS